MPSKLLTAIVNSTRQLHITNSITAAGMFRARRRLPASNNEWGPLTDLPDYTVIGKPSPIYTSEGQRRRAIRNYLYSKDVVKLAKQVMELKTGQYTRGRKQNS